ncbi:MAG: TIGR02391 family protein [Candidatus Aenigmarchaeota archaeon]|nr:TIGR02391 family protein [Candidatus Aenigmarchaeota archaeon]
MPISVDFFKEILKHASAIQKECGTFGHKRDRTVWQLHELYDSLITEVELIAVTKRLFLDGHYTQAIEEAYKLLNNSVKFRANVSNDGSSLMKNVFSLNNPCLRINRLKTQTQRDQQLGYMEIMSGCMIGIRNPRAHEHSFGDDPSTALELLALANHLLRVVRRSCKSRKRKQGSP